MNIQNRDLALDAWGRNKTVMDLSLLHGMFTYNIPSDMWKESLDNVESNVFSKATSNNGKLRLTSTATLNEISKLETFRKVRYQPNRGHLYSTSIFIPEPSVGINRFGIFTSENGVYFEVREDKLFAVRKSLGVVKQEVECNLFKGGDTSNDIDLSKGNIFDIQFQWRGVGSYFFFVNQTKVATFETLGTLDELSISNPALPIAFESINTGDGIASLECGCVDVTSEGGQFGGGTYGSMGINTNSGQVVVSGYNIPVIALRSKGTVDGKINTRDTLALASSSYGDQRCVARLWKTRDMTAITTGSQTWLDYGDGHLEYMIYNTPTATTPMLFDTSKAKLISTNRINQDETYNINMLFENKAEIYLTSGDMFVFTMHRETGGAANVGTTFEFSEEI